MPNNPSRRSILTGTAAVGLLAPITPSLAQTSERPTAPMQAVLDYAESQDTTGFLIVQNRKTLVEKNWPLPADVGGFRFAVYGNTADGAWSAPHEVIHPLCWSEDHFGWMERWQGSATSRKRLLPSCGRLMF
jgi:hypothetical protein